MMKPACRLPAGRQGGQGRHVRNKSEYFNIQYSTEATQNSKVISGWRNQNCNSNDINSIAAHVAI